MKRKNLYLLVGIPGSGKSTWAKNKISFCENIVHISRDNVRLNMLQENDSYFAKEKDVFRKYVAEIQEGLNEGYDVIADATHLNAPSRNKLLDRLNLEGVDIVPVVFVTPFDICKERNNKRKGRARVPDDVLESMAKNFSIPNAKEKYHYKSTHIIGGDN